MIPTSLGQSAQATFDGPYYEQTTLRILLALVAGALRSIYDLGVRFLTLNDCLSASANSPVDPTPMSIQHIRHGELSPLERERELLLVCPHFRSSVNLSRIVRLASCCGLTRMVVAGTNKIDPKIARDGAEFVEIERRRSLAPVIRNLREQGHRVVGLEQTNESKSLHDYSFSRKTALIIGHERLGISDEELKLLDDAIEIPVYGLPYSYNVVTATTMALYEYCRQFPKG